MVREHSSKASEITLDRLSADEEADEYTAKQEAGYLNDHEGEWPHKE